MQAVRIGPGPDVAGQAMYRRSISSHRFYDKLLIRHSDIPGQSETCDRQATSQKAKHGSIRHEVFCPVSNLTFSLWNASLSVGSTSRLALIDCSRSISRLIDRVIPPRQRSSTFWVRSFRQSIRAVCALVLLDLTAAIDTVDHSILLTMLKERFGVQTGVFDWFSSYLERRTQCVSAPTGRSGPVELTCGVPQGSVLGPVKFIAYTEDLHTAINKFPSLHQCFEDDTQLLARVAVNDVNLARRCLESCVTDIHDWCTRRRLQLNPEKNRADLVLEVAQIWIGCKR